MLNTSIKAKDSANESNDSVHQEVVVEVIMKMREHIAATRLVWCCALCSREAVVLLRRLAQDLAVVLHLVVLGVDGREERAVLVVREPDRRQRPAPAHPTLPLCTSVGPRAPFTGYQSSSMYVYAFHS